MRVLHLVAGELNGGAARGAYWLHRALCELGVDSTVLGNARDTLGDPSVITVAGSTSGKLKIAVSRRAGKAPVRLYRNRRNMDFNTGFDGINVARHPACAAADLVHLHWVNGLVSVRALRKIRKPMVWTLRDMWPMTGGCHHSLDCERFRDACGRCPQLGSTRERDLTRLVMRHKRRSLPADIRVIGISRWLSDRAQQSALLGGYQVATISNNVDTQLFTPIEKSLARQVLGIEKDRKVLLVGAQNVASAYKGFDLFLEAIAELEKDHIQVLLFGKRTASLPDSLGIRSRNLGFLADTISLRLAYSAADVFIAPSRVDAFGKTLAEAMACATPVVCFDATGPRDIVQHRITGYAAEAFDAPDLARGVRWILDRPSAEYEALCANARKRAEQCFDSRVIAGEYFALYREMLATAAPDVNDCAGPRS